jgi:regulator of RNase E activity RraA
VFWLSIRPGDLIHADRHGAVVIDPSLAGELPRAIDLVARREHPILQAVRSPGFDIERLTAA